MEFVSIIVAAGAAFAFGAIWYMALAKPWMAAAGITDETVKKLGVKPFIISAICLIIVTGMMHHVFALSDIDSIDKGVVAGLGVGLFIVVPWIATNYVYSDRPRMLTLIDGGYATGGCTVIGLVLTLF